MLTVANAFEESVEMIATLSVSRPKMFQIITAVIDPDGIKANWSWIESAIDIDFSAGFR